MDVMESKVTSQVIQGDTLTVLRTLPDESVNCCVTSPPYFGLRDYSTATWEGGDPECDHAPKVKPRSSRASGGLTAGKATVDAGTILRNQCPCGATRIDQQLGLEQTPDEYVAKLVEVFREVKRVLRPDGTCWLVIGDSYASGSLPMQRMRRDGGQTRAGEGDVRTVLPPNGATEVDGGEPREGTSSDGNLSPGEQASDQRPDDGSTARNACRNLGETGGEMPVLRGNGAGISDDRSRTERRSQGSKTPETPDLQDDPGRGVPDGSLPDSLLELQCSEGDTGRLSTFSASSLKPKDLIGVPWMLAFALRADGWYLRSDIVWCLSGGTWVYARTQKGDMPMMLRDAARLDPQTVKLWNGQKWTQVLGWSHTARNADELEIVLRSGERISCTPTHRFPTNRGLLDAGDLVIGDRLTRVSLPEPERPRDSAHIGAEAAWLAGLYLAEGSRSGNSFQISGHVKEEERWLRVRTIVESYGGTATRAVNGNAMNIRIYGRVVQSVIDHFVCGKTAKDKGLNTVAWRYSNRVLRALLDGYLSGDGHWDELNKRWRLGFTRNYAWERDLRTLSARLGFHLVLNLSFATYQGGVLPSFRGELRFERSGHWNEAQTHEIAEIRRARCREVYDVGVEDEPHLFALASGILTHNSKPNPMPESVTDRPTKAHEYVFLLSKSEQYFYDADAIAEPAAFGPERAGTKGVGAWNKLPLETTNGRGASTLHGYKPMRNKRSVWEIQTRPFIGAHFAVFPEELAEPCILAGTSEKGCCSECGAPWKRVTEVDRSFESGSGRSGILPTGKNGEHMQGGGGTLDIRRGPVTSVRTTGWEPTCAHAAPIIPAVVLDPFTGSGTTLAVAVRLGRSGLGIELNPDYVALAEKRLRGETTPLALFEEDAS